MGQPHPLWGGGQPPKFYLTPAVNHHDATTPGSTRVEPAVKGREFVIAKAGRPQVCVPSIAAIPSVRAMALLAGKGVITAAVKTACQTEICTLFAQAG